MNGEHGPGVAMGRADCRGCEGWRDTGGVEKPRRRREIESYSSSFLLHRVSDFRLVKRERDPCKLVSNARLIHHATEEPHVL